MRILCTCHPTDGHFHPLRPLAHALESAGHDVAFATAREFSAQVERAGFVTLHAGMDAEHARTEAMLRFPDAASLPPEERCRFGATMFTAVAAPAMARDLASIVAAWEPDVVLHDGSEFAAPLVATQAGIPYANHSFGPLRPLEVSNLAADIIATLWENWGLEPQPWGGMFRYLYLDICPPTLQSPEGRDIAVAHLLRSFTTSGYPEGGFPDWLSSLPVLPTVYVTLGTVFNRDLRVFATILEGLRDEPLNVIVTVGNDNDTASLGPQPENVHVERYIDQSLLLPHVDIVVTHGGSGSMLGALAHGLPLLVVPQGADQFLNSDRCVAAGVARRLLPFDLQPNSVRSNVGILLEEPEYQEHSRRLQEEIEQMPGPEKGVELLERLARERKPLTRAGLV